MEGERLGKAPITIKGNQNGLRVYLTEEVEFVQILESLRDKLKSSGDFFVCATWEAGTELDGTV